MWPSEKTILKLFQSETNSFEKETWLECYLDCSLQNVLFFVVVLIGNSRWPPSQDKCYKGPCGAYLRWSPSQDI